MVRVVGKEGALGAGVGGKCSSGMDDSEKVVYGRSVMSAQMLEVSLLGV